MPFIARPTLLAALLALAAPVAASAATKEVSTAADLTAAGTSAVSGDTIHVHQGVYVANVTVSAAGVTIDADPGAILVNDPTKTSPTLTFSAGSGSPDVVNGLYVLNTAPPASSSSLGPAAIQAGDNGLTLQRSLALSYTGDALSSTAGMSSPDRTITVDSSMLFATGKGAAAIRATASNLLPATPAGVTTIVGHHVTALGTSTVVLDNSAANGAPAVLVTPASPSGNMTATFTDSILLGKRSTATNTSPTSAPNTATIDTTTRNGVADDASTAAALFVNPAKGNYHLRADSPAIGQGGFTSGESATDIDGNAIPATNSDLGADQFVNRPPTAVLGNVPQSVRQDQPVSFDASGSRDPDANIGGGIVAYHWNFGDGHTATTTTPTASHAYTVKQPYAVTVTVTDRQGASATSDPQGLTVIDGVPPTITVAGPRSGQKIKAYRTRRVKHRLVRTATRLPVAFFGSATDDVALGKVVLALRSASSKNFVCKWFDGKRSLKSASCGAPRVFAPGTVLNGGWRYALPLKAKLPPGAYKLYAIPVDASGLAGTASIVSFRLR